MRRLARCNALSGFGLVHGMTDPSTIRFCSSADGTRLAMALSGAGRTVVAVRLWSGVEILEAPTFTTRHWAEELSRDFLYARYDARGIGLSQRGVTRLTLDAWVEDLEAVVDAIGSDTVALIAFSHAAAVAIRYAVRHPERVSHFAVYGGCTRGLLRRTEDERAVSAAHVMIQMAEAAYGNHGSLGASFRHSFYLRWRPGLTSEQVQIIDTVVLERIGQIGFPYTAAAHDVDVSDEARRVTCPTLVFHARGDTFIPYDEGRLMASLIPGAKLVSFDSANHLPLETDPEWPAALHELRSFLDPDAAASTRRESSAERSTRRLTTRQVEVLRLIEQGQTDKQIARMLGLSHRTVEMHVSRLLEALSCHTRAEAVHVAAKRGLLE